MHVASVRVHRPLLNLRHISDPEEVCVRRPVVQEVLVVDEGGPGALAGGGPSHARTELEGRKRGEGCVCVTHQTNKSSLSSSHGARGSQAAAWRNSSSYLRQEDGGYPEKSLQIRAWYLASSREEWGEACMRIRKNVFHASSHEARSVTCRLGRDFEEAASRRTAALMGGKSGEGGKRRRDSTYLPFLIRRVRRREGAGTQAR